MFLIALFRNKKNVLKKFFKNLLKFYKIYVTIRLQFLASILKKKF